MHVPASDGGAGGARTSASRNRKLGFVVLAAAGGSGRSTAARSRTAPLPAARGAIAGDAGDQASVISVQQTAPSTSYIFMELFCAIKRRCSCIF